MAFVIAQACIGVKDAACVDACPVDSIHAYADSNQFFIEPATCIDCAACEPACPVKAIFPGDQVPADQQKFIAINADFFKGFDKAKSATYARQKKEGEPKEGVKAPDETQVAQIVEVAHWVEQPGWQAEWDKAKDETVDRLEEQKRYGRVRAVFDEPDRYTLRFYLPIETPIHPFVFKYGLPREMCSYDVTAELKGNTATVRGKVSDLNIAKLSGHANSFPDRFYVEYNFEEPVTSVSVTPKGPHVVEVVAMKEARKAKAA